MAKRLTEEERLAIIAWFKSGHSMRQTALKFKRSTGTIHRIVHEAEDSTDEETQFFLKEIERSKRTHDKKVKQTIFELMMDDTSVKIIERFKNLLMDDLVCGASAMDKGIAPFVQAIQMFSQQNINIQTLEIKKSELRIKEKELNLKIKGNFTDLPDGFDVEASNRSYDDAMLQAIKDLNMDEIDSLIDPDSLIEVKEEEIDDYVPKI